MYNISLTTSELLSVLSAMDFMILNLPEDGPNRIRFLDAMRVIETQTTTIAQGGE